MFRGAMMAWLLLAGTLVGPGTPVDPAWLSSFIGPKADEPDAAPELRNFAGTYHYLGGNKQKREMEAAVEVAIADMFGMIKGIARRRLRETQQPRTKLEIAVSGERVKIGLPGNTTLDAVADGKPFQFKGGDGIWRKTTVRRRGRSIVVNIVGTKDKTVFIFRLGQGGWLTMKTRIEHVRMPAPLVLRYTYKR